MSVLENISTLIFVGYLFFPKGQEANYSSGQPNNRALGPRAESRAPNCNFVDINTNAGSDMKCNELEV